MEFDRKRHRHEFINIAPLVDVVFLLLLFFMISSNLIKEPAIAIRLPESRTAEVRNETVKTIIIARGGEIYFMDTYVDLKDLQNIIRDNTNDIKKDLLRIKADKDVDVGLLVNVIDEVRLSGVINFSIVTERG